MVYKKSGDYTNLNDYIKAISGYTIRGLNRFKQSYFIPNLDKVANRIKKAAADKQLIYVYGDYDTDGITSVSEMAILLNAIGANFQLYCPRRFSDGYGINANTINFVPDGALLITIDNGITAIDALEAAAKRGIEVIILDHHMAAAVDENHIVLPHASIIVDPEALSEGCDWDGYCGAGLACELAKIMLTPGSLPLEHIKALAAIGTVADIVPLISANRKIVKEGLENINAGIMPLGLKTLVDQVRIVSKIQGPILSEHLGYYISPTFNAAGRMIDTGAMGVTATVLASTVENAANYSAQLINWNTQRKSITQDALNSVQIDDSDSINFVTGDIPAGCVGLVAGELVKHTGKPSFVSSKSEKGIYVGSVRSNHPLNNVKHMLDACGDLLLAHGGHAEAAGFSFKVENFDKVHAVLSSIPLVQVATEPMYDLDIEPIQIPAMMTELDSVEPFGKGVERPLFRLKVDFNPGDVNPTKDGVHLQMKLPGNIKAMAFHMAERYSLEGNPTSLYLYGDLKWNYYRDTQSPQMIVKDYEIA